MFTQLFATSGLSLDRLRALVEVGAAGSIVRACTGDPIKQSQYSRQIKELEDFFQVPLLERHGKGIRLTEAGKELARISRFFLIGLSNFQRGCLAEEQIYRIGASATFIEHALLPVLADQSLTKIRYQVETVADTEIERRLHDLTLDFGVVTAKALSRPLQLKELGNWRLRLWVPKGLYKTGRQALEAFQKGKLPLALASQEEPLNKIPELTGCTPRLVCSHFQEALTALESERLAAILPDFLTPEKYSRSFLHVQVPFLESRVCHYRLAWNPRLLRLNSHAVRRRDALIESLSSRMRGQHRT